MAGLFFQIDKTIYMLYTIAGNLDNQVKTARLRKKGAGLLSEFLCGHPQNTCTQAHVFVVTHSTCGHPQNACTQAHTFVVTHPIYLVVTHQAHAHKPMRLWSPSR